MKLGGQGTLAFGGGGAWRGYSDAAREESGEDAGMRSSLACWTVGWWVFPHFHLATPGPFPTEERFSLKELIRRCFAPKWLLWLFCSLRRLSAING